MAIYKNKTLILIEADPKVDIFFNDWLSNGYKAEVMFKKVCAPLRAIRRIWLSKGLPFSNMWFGSWLKQLNNYECVIIHMNWLTLYLPLLINKLYPNIRIICWYWNTVDNRNKPIQYNNKNIELWTFDDNDSIRYNMHKNIQYYCPVNISSDNKEYDIYYIGRNRNRIDRINEIKGIASKLNLNYKFKVIEDNSDDITPYSEVKKDIAKAKAILEINKKDQVGFTLRTLESLFFGVKLITDNKYIKKSPIYNKDNVFIISEDNYEDLKQFINSDFNHSVDYLKDEYCLDKWFNNFGIDNGK